MENFSTVWKKLFHGVEKRGGQARIWPVPWMMYL